MFIDRVLTVEVCVQVDVSDDRVSARIQQQFMGANPRAAVGADMPFDRLNTFKQSDSVRTTSRSKIQPEGSLLIILDHVCNYQCILLNH